MSIFLYSDIRLNYIHEKVGGALHTSQSLKEFKSCIDFDFAGRFLHGFAQSKWTGGLTNITKWSNHCFLFQKSQWLQAELLKTHSDSDLALSPLQQWKTVRSTSSGSLKCKSSVESTRCSPSSFQHTSLLLLNKQTQGMLFISQICT